MTKWIKLTHIEVMCFFRVKIFAQKLASHVGIINSFADISFVLGEDFVLCQDKI